MLTTLEKSYFKLLTYKLIYNVIEFILVHLEM